MSHYYKIDPRPAWRSGDLGSSTPFISLSKIKYEEILNGKKAEKV